MMSTKRSKAENPSIPKVILPENGSIHINKNIKMLGRELVALERRNMRIL